MSSNHSTSLTAQPAGAATPPPLVHAHVQRVHTEDVILDIGGDMGALVIYAPAALAGKEIELRREGATDQRTHVDVAERHVNGRTIYAAVYPPLPAGCYRVWVDYAMDAGAVDIGGGNVAQLDLRTSFRDWADRA